jgi:hypothetical protein
MFWERLLDRLCGKNTFQDRFRRMLLQAYGGRCCLCESKFPALLVASHLIPRPLNCKNRLNPQNGLLLCRTHDCLFETGLIRISTQLEVEVVEDRPSVLGRDLANVLTHHTRRRVRRPRRGFEPTQEFMRWSDEHRLYRPSVSRLVERSKRPLLPSTAATLTGLRLAGWSVSPG